MGHALCAAHELPVTPEDYPLWDQTFADLLALLDEDGDLVRSGETFYFNGQTYPSKRVNIRSSSSSPVHLRDAGRGNRLVETLDIGAALSEVYPGAVYTHQGDTFVVKSLDLNTHTAVMDQQDVDYYTLCDRDKSTEILPVDRTKELFGHRLYTGQLRVTSRVTGFVKKHEQTGQVVGGGKLELSEQVLETTGMWVVLNQEAAARSKEYGLHLMGAARRRARSHRAVAPFRHVRPQRPGRPFHRVPFPNRRADHLHSRRLPRRGGVRRKGV